MARSFSSNSAAVLTLATLALSGLPALAETWTIQGRTAAIGTIENHELADGSIVQLLDFPFVQENLVDGAVTDTFSGHCIGMGTVTIEGVFAGSMRCDLVLSAEDAYTITYLDDSAGAVWEVTGGKGKFAGASGSGTTTYLWGDTVFGDKVIGVTEGTITVP